MQVGLWEVREELKSGFIVGGFGEVACERHGGGYRVLVWDMIVSLGGSVLVVCRCEEVLMSVLLEVRWEYGVWDCGYRIVCWDLVV